MKRVHFFVSGVVQGVFYRQNSAKKARELELKGFVRNTPDGKVEILVEGENKRINEFMKFCKNHPGYSKVEKIHIEKEVNSPSFTVFKIEY